jgi:hypothetical protein
VSKKPPKPPKPDPTPPRTITVPLDKRPVIRDEDLIVALRELGADVELALPTTRGRFTLGRGERCDLVLASLHVSTEHCVLERRKHAIRVVDQDSHNGTVFEGKREHEFQIGVGDRFQVATTTLYALDAAMRDARPAFGDVLGYDQHATIDELLLEVIEPAPVPILLLGPPGSGFAHLARAIHEASPRRLGAFLEIDAEATATSSDVADSAAPAPGTVFVDLTRRPTFDAAALDRPEHARVVAASSEKEATAALGLERLTGAHRVAIPPLKQRAADLLRLLDRLLAQQGSPLTTDRLSLTNQRGLVKYKWPDNFREMLEVCRWLPLVALHGVRGTERLTGIARATLSGWAKRRGLHPPLLADDLSSDSSDSSD